ncbi:MAG: hypothetical protein WCX73_05280 [Candidatus Pacearchaeota archaeon]|jgi:hypothetical protein
MEITTKELPEIELRDVVSIYIGKPDRCMCGCSGIYTYTKVNQTRGTKIRGYEVTDKEVNDKLVERIIKKIKKSAINGISVLSVNGGFCLTIIIGKTQYSIYTL